MRITASISRKALKSQIKKKFGSLSQFARLADNDNPMEFRNKLQIFFAVVSPNPDFYADVIDLANTLSPDSIGGPIDPKKLALLKTKINEAGGPSRFCDEHSQFPQFSVYQILSGNRKIMTQMVQDLFDHFQLNGQNEA